MTRNKLCSHAKIASPSYCEYPNNILQKIEVWIIAISTKNQTDITMWDQRRWIESWSRNQGPTSLLNTNIFNISYQSCPNNIQQKIEGRIKAITKENLDLQSRQTLFINLIFTFVVRAALRTDCHDSDWDRLHNCRQSKGHSRFDRCYATAQHIRHLVIEWRVNSR